MEETGQKPKALEPFKFETVRFFLNSRTIGDLTEYAWFSNGKMVSRVFTDRKQAEAWRPSVEATKHWNPLDS